MTIHQRTDSDGITHQVWAQRQPASCAIASMWMAKSIAQQMTLAEGEWALAARTFSFVVKGFCLGEVALGDWNAVSIPAPQTFMPSSEKSRQNQNTMANMYGSFGTSVSQLIAALRAQSLRVELQESKHLLHQLLVTNTPSHHLEPLALPVDPLKLSDDRPAISFLHWIYQAHRVGGHFVVAAREARNGRIVFLEPWGGVVREVPNNGTYPGGGAARGVFSTHLYLSA
ncbi:hypothetical protein SAMN05421538_105156 [Paracoccus isoporae]|uniref:Uncharacterized protein n=1 Tax=Paracoccus isoporae TaxID=591205 RepID=A0A1G7BNN6_9RHOB|nr:hypothetical protein [Paracoccus isoporae]SDE28738.1 hypothetical protein SAMN05421538_105156 [Paracoccus isoporae]